MSNRSRSERSNAIALLASFLVIAAGLAAALVVCTISAPEPKVAIPAAIGVFFLIALIPFNSLRERSMDAGRVPRRGPSLWKRIRVWWMSRGKDREQDEEPKLWKRRRSTRWVENSVFIAEKRDIQPPFQG